jgi:hypothetical protein
LFVFDIYFYCPYILRLTIEIGTRRAISNNVMNKNKRKTNKRKDRKFSIIDSS